jgi:thiol-disulfide isomerase/thioredoxin
MRTQASILRPATASAAAILLALGLGAAGGAVRSAASAAAATAARPSIEGMWDATIRVKDADVPFRMRFSGSDRAVTVTYFDGERPVNASTGGALSGDRLHVDFASYASQLDARLHDGVLRGALGVWPFEAHRHTAAKAGVGKAPDIAGVWEIPTETEKGEKAWRLVVRQTPMTTYATILRIDGDMGTISGGYANGAFHLSRFAGERPSTLVITPQPDGTLSLLVHASSGRHDLKALRPAAARAVGLAAPDDPARHTGVRNPAEAFRFSGVEIDGKTVTNADPRFKGKVVLVNVMGSWCPNCHDEAPFLAELDARYRSRGLQVVSLAFENPDELKSLTRLKAFVARYNLRYEVLVGGDRDQVNARLPQAVNLNAWPTTFFLDRHGRVHSVHVGFPSQGSGPYDVAARAGIAREIEGLLAQKS